jgi:hypothetical protein
MTGEGGADEAGGARAAALAGWFRSEVARSPSPGPERIAPARINGGISDRILIGMNGDVAEARIRIGTGALSGTELTLSSSGGRLVEAALLTCAAGSRQTLSVALDEIRSRLREKGVVLLSRPGGRTNREMHR